MGIRAKMMLCDVVNIASGARKALFQCQYDSFKSPEDVSFMKATPWGQVEFILDNPEASKQLTIGEYYYFDIYPVPKPKPAEPAGKIEDPKPGTEQTITS